MRWMVCGTVCLLFLLSRVETAMAQRAVFLVRHAEKETDRQHLDGLSSDDEIPLTKAGATRAAALAELLKDAGIDAIYTSRALRTQHTARPLADALNLSAKPIGSDTIERFGELHRDQIVLVVGHSNTVPEMIDALIGRPSGLVIRDDEFDALFILVQKGDGGWSLARARY